LRALFAEMIIEFILQQVKERSYGEAEV
jgi:hypothetical protein